MRCNAEIKRFVKAIDRQSGTKVFDDRSVVRYAFAPAIDFLQTMKQFDDEEEKERSDSGQTTRVRCGENEKGVIFAIYVQL